MTATMTPIEAITELNRLKPGRWGLTYDLDLHRTGPREDFMISFSDRVNGRVYFEGDTLSEAFDKATDWINSLKP